VRGPGRRRERDAAGSVGRCLLRRVRELHVRDLPGAFRTWQITPLFQPWRARAWSSIRCSPMPSSGWRRYNPNRRWRSGVVCLPGRKRIRAHDSAGSPSLLDITPICWSRTSSSGGRLCPERPRISRQASNYMTRVSAPQFVEEVFLRLRKTSGR
jgi:hypothetical protein